jgi:hypothetical protein
MSPRSPRGERAHRYHDHHDPAYIGTGTAAHEGGESRPVQPTGPTLRRPPVQSRRGELKTRAECDLDGLSRAKRPSMNRLHIVLAKPGIRAGLSCPVGGQLRTFLRCQGSPAGTHMNERCSYTGQAFQSSQCHGGTELEGDTPTTRRYRPAEGQAACSHRAVASTCCGRSRAERTSAPIVQHQAKARMPI